MTTTIPNISFVNQPNDVAITTIQYLAIGSQQEALNDLDHFCSVDNATASVYLMRVRA